MPRSKITIHLFIVNCALAISLNVAADIPTALTDNIKKGSGTINLLTDVTSVELKNYLQSGTLNLGIDLNEAASGNETSTSQGIAIRELELILITSNGEMSFDNFFTNTTASILESGAQSAQEFTTTFGRTGSNGINGSGFSNYDDVIYVTGIDIGDASITGAQLRINFVNTALNAGFNEEFFDYSGGYENFAILDTATAQQVEASNESILQEVSSIESDAVKLTSPAGTPEPGWYFTLGAFAIAFNRWKRKTKPTSGL